MREGWREETLGSVCQLLKRGISPKYVESGGVAVLNQKCIRGHSINFELGRRHDSDARKVAPECYLKSGDVLINSTGTGTLGRVAQLREEPSGPTTVDSHVTIVRPRSGLFYPDLFGYALISIEKQIQDGGEGCGGQTELARSKLSESYKVRFPVNLLEQRRIVDILDEAFAAIATAKANTEKNLQNAREAFDDQLRVTFERRGARWIERTLSDTCEMYQPKTISKKEMVVGGKYPVFGANGIIGRYDKYNHEEPQLLVTCRGATCGSVNMSASFSWINGNAMVVRPKTSEISLKFLEYFFRGGFDVSKAITGSAQPQITRVNLNPLTICYPQSASDQSRLVALFDHLDSEASSLRDIYRRKLGFLDELKQSLLHQAFTGALTAKTVDRQLAEAV